MIDIHTHILPGLDDGPDSMEVTAEMIAMARAHGTTALVASPHADPQYPYDPDRVDRLLEEARAFAGAGMSLVRGCDFHLTIQNVDDAVANPGRYAIGGKSYILMELSDLVIFPNTSLLWRRLEDAGHRIILTHPERNPLLRQRLELITQWVGEGRYMQVTAQSLLGRFGPKARSFARSMLDRGLVHFIASDAHDLLARPPVLDQAYRWLCDEYSPRLAELLCVEHPMAALTGQELDLTGFPPPRERNLLRSWLRHFRSSGTD
jgi:protein-tyrosine phosphatase